ncbi:MAG: SurA N-terminal domain-containing protein [Chromatiales bacterium]|nr:SurA N-terminal domain-containing protein [Chromatiales bacterium]
MLQTIREKLTGWIALAVVGIIGLSLALTFTGSPTIMGSDYAARVNGEDITVNEFREAFQNELFAQQQQFGGIELPDFFLQQLQREVLEGLIINRIIRQFVRDAGFGVSDLRVAEEIRRQPALQVGGQFSPETYIALLASQGLSPQRFEAEQRDVMTVQQLQLGLLESSFYTPAEFRRFLELEAEQRDVAWALIDPAALLAGVQVDEAAVEAFYQANPDRFRTQESVRLQYIEVSLAELAASIEVDEEDLRAAYEQQRSRFMSAEERRARHILFAIDSRTDAATARARAEEAAARLAAGEDFAALARELSDDPGSAAVGGDLGFAARGVFVGAFEDTLFALEDGQTSDPVQTEFGWHIIRLEETRGEAGLSFAEARDELLEELQLRLAEDTYFRLADAIDDLALENPGTLEPAAEQTGLELREITRFTRSGGQPLGFSATLVAQVFSPVVLEDGENTALVEIEDGRAVVARVLEHRPSVVRPLAEVRGDIVEELRLAQAAQSARNRGERMLERAAEGEFFELLVEDLGGEFSGNLRIGRQTRTAPPELVAAMFRAPRPASPEDPVFRGVPLSDGSYAVFRLDAVIAGRAEDLPRDERDQRKALLTSISGNQDIQALVTQLRRDARVSVRQGLFDQPDTL